MSLTLLQLPQCHNHKNNCHTVAIVTKVHFSVSPYKVNSLYIYIVVHILLMMHLMTLSIHVMTIPHITHYICY